MSTFLGLNNSDYKFVEVSIGNSKQSIVTTGSPFNGKFERVTHHSVFTVLLSRAPLTSTGTLIIEQSINGNDVHYTEEILVINGIPLKPLKFDIFAEYVRVRYVPNDDTLTDFNLLTRYHTYQTGSTAGITDSTPIADGGPYIGEPLAYTEITGVVDGVETTITSYLAASDTAISMIYASGNLNAKFRVFLNGSPILAKIGTLNVDINLLPGLLLTSGDTLEVKVLQSFSGETGDYNASIFGGV
jgi:hypothetical protein